MRSGPEDDNVYLAQLKEGEKRFTEKVKNLKEAKDDPWAENSLAAAERNLKGVQDEISKMSPKKDDKPTAKKS